MSLFYFCITGLFYSCPLHLMCKYNMLLRKGSKWGIVLRGTQSGRAGRPMRRAMGQRYILFLTSSSAVRNLPSSLEKTLITCPTGHKAWGNFWSTIMTSMPGCRFSASLCHFWQTCSSGRLLQMKHLHKWSANSWLLIAEFSAHISELSALGCSGDAEDWELRGEWQILLAAVSVWDDHQVWWGV